MYKTIILRPRMSEKTYAQGQTQNVYVFDVPSSATKHTVARAVAEQFEVVVKDVNIANIKGKAVRTFRKGGRFVPGQRSAIKKAYVTLEEGHKLPFFEAAEEEEKKQAQREEKISKVAEKAAKKAAKKEKK